ncbi:hypothetical protein [Allofournierella sp.]|uniref:hypothetical protein n=1 Tax=Allofournierella sp. TaxID=1940256 RepID=UPI003AB12E96
MKFLFILDSVEYPLAPNPVLARRVAACLARKGHAVDLLELWDGETPPPAAPGCRQFRLAFADEREMNRALEFGRAGGSPLPLRLARLTRHPSAVLAAVRQLPLKRPRRVSAARREIERLDLLYHYDAAVAVAAPYAGSFALAGAAFGGRKASWQMDPYAANRSYAAPGAWEKELELGLAMDCIFAAPTANADFAPGAPLYALAGRVQTLDFPGLTPPVAFPSTSSPGTALRCVFAGSLYPQLRTPHFALQLFAALNAPDLLLTFLGGGWQNYPPSLLPPYQELLGDRLAVAGPVPPARAAEAVANADVLLSLGNGVDNQVPSKLFEYLASGKPILHLAKLASDPCLPYLKKWPLACVVQESEGLTEPVLARVRSFLQQKGRRRLPFTEAARLYPENTPEHAAALFERVLTAP